VRSSPPLNISPTPGSDEAFVEVAHRLPWFQPTDRFPIIQILLIPPTLKHIALVNAKAAGNLFCHVVEV
jgi:hypothetical protein